MTCIGTSKLNGLMWIPLALARISKLYCLATMALQKVGRIIDGSVIDNRMVALQFLGGMEGRDLEIVAVGEQLRPPFALFDCNEGRESVFEREDLLSRRREYRETGLGLMHRA